MQILQPDGWAKPKGYSNGIAARGRTVFIAGQVGWDANEKLVGDDFYDQTRQALENIKALLAEAGAGPEHLTRMTWFVTSKDEYFSDPRRLGEAYRAVIGKNYPTMTAVQVVQLMVKGAKVEIEATAVVPD